MAMLPDWAKDWPAETEEDRRVLRAVLTMERLKDPKTPAEGEQWNAAFAVWMEAIRKRYVAPFKGATGPH